MKISLPEARMIAVGILREAEAERRAEHRAEHRQPRTMLDRKPLLLTVATLLAAALLLVLVALARAQERQYASPWNAACDISNMSGMGGSGGSGSLVGVSADRGLVLTCWHIFDGGTGRVTCRFPNGFQSTARVLGLYPTHDLAALEIVRPPGIEPLLIRDAKPEDGPFTVVGFPYFGGFRFTSGRLLQPYLDYEIRVGTPTYSGFSGGPCVNRYGEIVGVCVTTSDASSSHVSYAAIKLFLTPWLADK